MTDFYREIVEPSKRQILAELRSGPRNVSDLVGATGLKQPNISNHLSKLRARGIVKSQKVGREVYYSLASAEIEEALRAVMAGDEAHDEDINVDDAAKQYAKAAVAGDEAACARLVDRLVRQGVQLVTIYQHVLAASMELVGKWYVVDAIDEGQEHLASAITERMMARVLHYSGPLKRGTHRAVLACVPGNYHSIGLRMISDFLALSGWTTFYMGANVPVDSLISAVKEAQPELVLVSVAYEGNMDAALEMVRSLRAGRHTRFQYLIGVGGSMVPSQGQQFLRAGADFLSTSLASFSEDLLPRIEAKDFSFLNRQPK